MEPSERGRLKDLIEEMIEIERRGERFYRRAAGRTSNTQTKALFRKLEEDGRTQALRLDRELLDVLSEEDGERDLEVTAEWSVDVLDHSPLSRLRNEDEGECVLIEEEPTPPDLYSDEQLEETRTYMAPEEILRLAMRIEEEHYAHLKTLHGTFCSLGAANRLRRLARDKKKHFKELWLLYKGYRGAHP